MLNDDSKKKVLLRLKKIGGQVRGLEKMVDEKRYCIDILDQISAVKKALDGVGMSLVKGHVQTCVANEIRSSGGTKKIDELVETLGRMVK
jgi:DNA-binding FrmR family transcriptional regulator